MPDPQTRVYSNTVCYNHYTASFPAHHDRLNGLWFRFARAPIPVLCTSPLFSHAELRPSTTEISSSAKRCANCPLPLPRECFLFDASRIHWTACRRRCLTPSGTGRGSAAPPPAAPFRARMRSKGATESMATVRYWMGSSGRWLAGGEPGTRGRAGFGTGGGAVRRWFRMKDMFYSVERTLLEWVL